MAISKDIRIVPFEEKYRQAFKELNQWWIERYFTMEEMDYKALDNPKNYILDNGGYIAVALLNEEPVGVCALIKMEGSTYDFELAKMGVSPKAHRKGVGYILGKAIIKKAIASGASNIFLETNSMLTPAINLYKKLGFKEITGIVTPYERSNYQMELNV